MNSFWHHGGRRCPLRLKFSTCGCLASPTIQLRAKCKNAPELPVEVPMDWKTFPLFPELHGTHFSAQIAGDFLPGIQAVRCPPQTGGLLRVLLRRHKVISHRSIDFHESGSHSQAFPGTMNPGKVWYTNSTFLSFGASSFSMMSRSVRKAPHGGSFGHCQTGTAMQTQIRRIHTGLSRNSVPGQPNRFAASCAPLRGSQILSSPPAPSSSQAASLVNPGTVSYYFACSGSGKLLI